MDHRRRGSRLMLVAGLAILLASLSIGTTAWAQARGRTLLRNSAPSWAKSSNKIREAPNSKQIDARVYLEPRNKAELDSLVKAVSDPSSSKYREFLTPDQYSSRFGPTNDQVTAVRNWLTGAGLKVTGVSEGNRYVAVRGNAGQAQKAFGAKLNLYDYKGKKAIAPSGDLTVPDRLSDEVLGVTDLESPGSKVKPATQVAPPPDGFRNARPCSAYYGQKTARYQADGETPLPKFKGSYRPYAVCGYVPSQFRGAYGATNSGKTGAGATVAITDAYAAPTIRKDANTYATRHGDAAFGDGQFGQVLPTSFRRQNSCDPSGWYGEETLDVEAVHGMAPDSKVLYYGSRSCYDVDFLDTLAQVVDDNKASIVTNSWSDIESNETSGSINAYESIFKQGAVQGIGFFFSSGDNGDEFANTGEIQTDYPASDPYVTAVGGTSLAVGQEDNYQFEAGWGTYKFCLNKNCTGKGDTWKSLGFLYGAGGGYSTILKRPAYQRGVVPASFPGGRAVPDIALDGDPTTGMLVGETQTFPNGVYYDEYRIGGTSLASPLMAGMQALATDAQNSRLGFANPRIYELARNESGTYRDVTNAHDPDANVRADYANEVNASDGILYSVRTFDDDSSLDTTAGWDDVTGVGSPNAKYINIAGQ